MNILLIGLYLYIFFIFLRMNKMIKKHKINFKYIVLNYLVLFFLVIVNLPISLNLITTVIDNVSRYQIIFFVFFMYLMYNNFILEFHIARINQEQEKIVGTIALLEEKVRKLQKTP